MQMITQRVVSGLAGLILACCSGLALADGPGPAGSTKDAAPAADEGRKLTYSWNIGATSDYIFRGVSQNARGATPQGGVDVTYGIGYAGIWASGTDFGQNVGLLPNGKLGGGAVAGTEIDYYAGIKPVWGPLTFDLGAIYYSYPYANDQGPRFGRVREQNYIEGKFGVSGTPVTNLTTGVTLFVSPQYTGGQGVTEVIEGTAAYELPKFGQVVPTVGGTLGGVFGDARSKSDPFTVANGKDSYLYWNAGITFGLDKLSIDFRYWDTNINDRAPGGPSGFCTGNGTANGTSGGVFQCDSRIVATAKVTF